MSQLTKLAKPIPPNLIEQVRKGGGSLDYVSHATINELLLGILGPFSMSVEPIRGYAPEVKGKNTYPAVENAIVGALVTLYATVDGVAVSITEAGDVEMPAMKDNDGSRMKDAISDGLKRCAMRLGVGLHLWSGDSYFLHRGLAAKEPKQDAA